MGKRIKHSQTLKPPRRTPLRSVTPAPCQRFRSCPLLVMARHNGIARDYRSAFCTLRELLRCGVSTGSPFFKGKVSFRFILRDCDGGYQAADTDQDIPAHVVPLPIHGPSLLSHGRQAFVKNDPRPHHNISAAACPCPDETISNLSVNYYAVRKEAIRSVK